MYYQYILGAVESTSESHSHSGTTNPGYVMISAAGKIFIVLATNTETKTNSILCDRGRAIILQ